MFSILSRLLCKYCAKQITPTDRVRFRGNFKTFRMLQSCLVIVLTWSSCGFRAGSFAAFGRSADLRELQMCLTKGACKGAIIYTSAVRLSLLLPEYIDRDLHGRNRSSVLKPVCDVPIFGPAHSWLIVCSDLISWEKSRNHKHRGLKLATPY